jgi:TetR/AcrR family transcriptional repressor of nem operon
VQRVERWLGREREVLLGCPIGGLAQDPDIVADADLRRPVEETMEWLHGRLTLVFEEGQEHGEVAAHLDAANLAGAVVAVLQGGYVLARAAGSPEPFHRAVRGVLQLIRVSGPSVER